MPTTTDPVREDTGGAEASTITDFRPDLGAGSAEPSIREIVRSYYGRHVDADRALRWADEYCAKIEAAAGAQSAVGREEILGG